MTGRGRYKMGTIARMTGLSPALLRAWERRYDLLEPDRTGGGHRLYTDEDLEILRHVKKQVDAGRAIGEVAAPGREVILETIRREDQGRAGGRVGRRAGDRPGQRIRPPLEAETDLEGVLEGIVAAAVDLDRDRLEEGLDRAFAMVSPPYVVSHVLEPAARRIGDLWMEGRCSVAGEHMASSAFVLRLQKLLEASNRSLGEEAPGVITASFPDELHEIGALVVAYELTLHGIRVIHLGPALPFGDLEAALDRLRPLGVYLSVTRRSLYEAHRARFLAGPRAETDRCSATGQSTERPARTSGGGLRVHHRGAGDRRRRFGDPGAGSPAVARGTAGQGAGGGAGPFPVLIIPPASPPPAAARPDPASPGRRSSPPDSRS